MSIQKAFYAYASQNQDVLDDIRNAVTNINLSQSIKITTWEDLPISGNYINQGILKMIDECDLFICDLTALNFNVLYELGFAIAKGKKIWISLNSTYPSAESNYKGLPITTIGYAAYQNSQQLVDNFFSDVPYENAKAININSNKNDLNKNLIYLQCEYNTSASLSVTRTLEKLNLPLKRDDPYEGAQPLNWYLDVLSDAIGVIIHFHNSDSEDKNPLTSARKSLIAGVAHGMGLKTLLLAHQPYTPPLDYHDELKVHSSTQQCETFLKEWLDPITEGFNTSEDSFREYRAEQKALGILSNLIIGDYIAENESQDLMEYFLETAEYKEALTSQQILFVGRKGTGKTANLIKLKNTLSQDRRNFTVTIQPQGHEFEGVLKILNELISTSEKGHLIESIWKYLIYTEIAKEYYGYIKSRPLHVNNTEEEKQFLLFIKQNERYINADFTLRLENIVQNLKKLNRTGTFEDQRLKVSEFLHESMINHLRVHLGNILNKREKVTILIDNLDKTWSDNAELEQLSKLLFGLLNIVHKITDEFSKHNYKQDSVNLSLIVFLRSDIFTRIMSFASERDKIPYKLLSWNEPRLLLRVIENRVKYSVSGVSSPEDLWNKYFCETVNGQPLAKFVEDLILPRPRDIIFLFKAALQEAINKGHAKVEEEDFLDAEYYYSEYALHSLFPENGGRVDNLEHILYEFAGEKSILTQEELDDCLSESSSMSNVELIKILSEMTFIGQEVRNNKFEYYSEKRPPLIIDKLADKLAHRNSRSKRFQINSAFHSYLEIEKDD